MGITTRRRDSKVVKAIVPLLEEDLFLVDVGVSMGYPKVWREYQPKLTVHGFDPLIPEIERLTAAEPDPKVHYHAAFVTPVSIEPMEKGSVKVFGEGGFSQRLAAVAAKRAIAYDAVKEEFNAGKEIKLAAKGVALDDFFPAEDHRLVDFIKVDTDGFDLPAIEGARQIIQNGEVLGLDLEVRFAGIQRDEANLFRNIDKLVGEAGFSMFHLEPRKYSRAALPRPFSNNRPTTSEFGQLRWANAVYMRDIGDPNFEKLFGWTPSLDKILKAICLFDQFDLPDCAAEIVFKYESRIGEVIETEALLDALTPRIDGQVLTYREYMEQFDRAVATRQFEQFGREILPELQPETNKA